MYKVYKKSSSGKTTFSHIIFFEVNNQKTLASAILLKDYYEKNDEDYLNNLKEIEIKINFSRDYLSKVLEKNGTIKCTYCNKKDLIIEYDGMKVPNSIKATIDHIIPKSKGGNHFDLNNITPCCGDCNTKKGNKDLEDFLKK